MSTVYFRITARGAPTRVRAPLLERLIARADRVAGCADWRAHAFRLIAPADAPLPAVASAAQAAGAHRTAGSWVCLATPVHLVAGMSSVGLAADGVLEIDVAEADALAADFNKVFGGADVRLERGRDALLLARFDAPLRATMSDPAQALGHDVWGYLPRGEDAPRVRRLTSEIEMWLFDHAVNRRRREQASATVSSLWLWGGGAGDAEAPAVRGWTAGEDPLFASFAPQSRYPDAPGSGVVTVSDWPGTSAWQEVEERWLVPAVQDLKAGRLEGIELSAGRRCVRLRARGLKRFWRRARPWWESFADGD